MTALSKLVVVMTCVMLIAGISGLTAPACAETAKENSTEAAQAKVTTSEQALKIAKAYFRLFNWAFDESPKTQVEVVNEKIIGIDRWKVKIGNDSINIDTGSGQVISARQFRPGLDRKNANKPMAIDKEQAVVLAHKWLELAGCKLDEGDAVVIRNEPYQMCVPNGFTEWVVVFRRQYRGYLFSHDLTQVSIDPYDESLVSLSYFYRMPLPESFETRISREDAEKIARTFFEEHKRPLGNVVTSMLVIVYPSNYWQAGFEKQPYSCPREKTRLAWVLRCDGLGKPEVWIDAITGEIIGGVQTA